MNKMPVFLFAILCLISCGIDSAGPNGETIINIRVINEFQNVNKIIARYQELTGDDPVLSMILPRFTFVSGGDYRDKLNMALVAQESFDLMFCGAWQGFTTFIQQEAFADLSYYFNNPDFPGLQKAFPPDLVKAMTFYIRNDDGSYRRGIYGINLAEFFEDTRGLIYREDLRKLYNAAPINCDQTLIEYFETVISEERSVVGKDWLGLSVWNLFRMETPHYWGKHFGVFAQDSTNLIGDQTHIYIGLSLEPDANVRRTVLNAVVAGDSPEEFAKMPAGFQYDFITEYHRVRADKWGPYMSPIRGTGDADFREFLASYSTLSGFESEVKELLDRTPDAEYGFYVLDEDQRNLVPGAVINEMVTNNWLVIPAWSKKICQTMRFLDWMFSSRENHDLFYYGIEGEDWIAIGDNSYKWTDIPEAHRYVMPTYSLNANPAYIRKSEFAASRPELEKRFEYMYDFSTYQLSPLAGFVFNPVRLQTEIANVTALSNELQLTIARYCADGAEQRIRDWHQAASRVGLERIRAELILQLQEFLDEKARD